MADRIAVQPYDREAVNPYKDYDGFGRPVLLAFDKNPFLAESGEDSAEQPTIVLARSINLHNQFAAPQAMLEVQVSQSSFAAFMGSLTDNAGISGLHITVFNAAGQVLYGESNGAALPAIQPESGWTRVGGNMGLLHSVFSGNAFVLFEIPVGIYYQKLTTFLLIAIPFSGILCGLMMAVSSLTSKKFVRPIQQLCTQLESIDLPGRNTFDKVSTDIYELDVLAQTVTDMNLKLIDSLDSIVALKTAEVQSRLLALQSQMQPHFLYNTLAAISTLNEQGKPQSVASLCAGLSQMMRYVSFEQDNVSLFEEVKFLRSYMAIMQERFPSAKLTLDIPLEMMQLRVPKLILQPMAENAFKYSGRTDTEIRVTGVLEGDRWTVTVSDNGRGFSPEQVEAITARIRQTEKDSALLSTQIDGMGLVNIYARLSMYYKGGMVFHITPGDSGIIEIGGTVQSGKG